MPKNRIRATEGCLCGAACIEIHGHVAACTATLRKNSVLVKTEDQ